MDETLLPPLPHPLERGLCLVEAFLIFFVERASLERHAAHTFSKLVAHPQQLMVEPHSLGTGRKIAVGLKLPPRRL